MLLHSKKLFLDYGIPVIYVCVEQISYQKLGGRSTRGKHWSLAWLTGMPIRFGTSFLPPAYVVRREGNSFTLLVCPRGGYPYPIMLCNISQNAMGQPGGGGYPARSSPGGYPARSSWGGLPWPEGGTLAGGGYPGWGVPWLGGYPGRGDTLTGGGVPS